MSSKKSSLNYFILVYLVLGHYYEHVGLMVSLQQRGLLSHGEYFVVGIDIEQYDPARPEKYLRGMLMEKVEPLAAQAFQSYLGIVPTAPVSFATFANEVSSRISMASSLM